MANFGQQLCLNAAVEEASGGRVAVFSAKHWDRRNKASLIESTTPRHDAQVVGSRRGSNQIHLIVLTSKSEDDTIAPTSAISKQNL